MKEEYKAIFQAMEDENPVSVKQATFHKHSRVMLVDGLNLFFRNFASLNHINHDGVHVGGLGGFIRSIATLVKAVEPTSIYLVFDGMGSTTNRKNLLPEYKSNRGKTRMTNWEIFDNQEEEDEAKFGQIARLIHYLRCLPVTIISVDKAEADDVIAYLAKKIVAEHRDSKAFIVSSDKDYIQLVDDQITVYRPIEKDFYTKETVKQKLGVLPENYILLKTLTGDKSDSVQGLKGMGVKTALKLFPTLATQSTTLQQLLQLSETKYKEHVLYAKMIFEQDTLKKTYRIMNLHEPILDQSQEHQIDQAYAAPTPPTKAGEFIKMCTEDGLGHLIKAPAFWVSQTFKTVKAF